MGMSIGAISLVRKCSVEVAKNMKYITTRAGNAIVRRFVVCADPPARPLSVFPTPPHRITPRPAGRSARSAPATHRRRPRGAREVGFAHAPR